MRRLMTNGALSPNPKHGRFGWLGAILGVVCVLVACGRESPRGLPQRPSVSAAPLGRVVEPPAAKQSSPKDRSSGAELLVMASEEGLFEIGRNGVPGRRLGLSKGASYPRFTADRGAVLFLVNNEALHEYTFSTQSERKLAGPWPTTSQCGQSAGQPLAPKCDDDVDVDEDNRHVCLDLLDRNVNMANVLVSLRIDRETGKVERRVLIDADCKTISDQEMVHCQTATPKVPTSATFPYAWSEAQHALTGPPERTWPVHEGFSLVHMSPDGRWGALRGNQEDHDYIHFNWLVLDLEQGSAFALPDSDTTRVGSWLAKVELSELRDPSRERLGPRAGDYYSEMPVRFVSANLLLADHLLIDLRARSIGRVTGDLAY
jgi:hypothetical protein